MKKRTLTQVIEEYREIRTKHPEATKSTWMQKHHCWLSNWLRRRKIKWNDFKKMCGYDDVILRRDNIDIDHIITEYRKIREKNPEAKKSTWMQKHHCWLSNWLSYRKIKWDEFKKMCGYDEEPLLRENMTLKKVIKAYQELRKEHQSAKSSSWMAKHHSWILNWLRRHNMKWDEFKKMCGYDEILRVDYVDDVEQVIKEYKEVVNKHPEAINSTWVKQHYGWITTWVWARKIKWGDFKEMCGYDRKRTSKGKKLPEVISSYKEVVKSHPEAINSTWVLKHEKYKWIYVWVRDHEISWNDFKIKCGLKNATLRRRNIDIK